MCKYVTKQLKTYYTIRQLLLGAGMKVGDIVVRNPIIKILYLDDGFNIDEDNRNIAIIKGVAFRIIADAYIELRNFKSIRH